MPTWRYLCSSKCRKVSYHLGFPLTAFSTYSPDDDSLNAVLMIALINFKVKHIVVTVSSSLHVSLRADARQGHTNCVGCNQSLNMSKLPAVPPTTALQRYVQPVAALARALAAENGTPPTLDLLVEVSGAAETSMGLMMDQENVMQQVKNLEVADVVTNVSGVVV